MAAVTCSVCNASIATGAVYYSCEIDTESAAALLDTTERQLVPTWEQLPKGMLRLTFCEACGSDVDAPGLLTGHVAR